MAAEAVGMAAEAEAVTSLARGRNDGTVGPGRFFPVG